MVRLYLKHPALATLLLSALAFAAVWSAPLFGGAVVPFDFQTANYPPFIDAIRAARFNPFCIYNPFNDAGQITPNLFAYFDPPAWVAALSPQFPSYAALQFYYLAHLMLIPVGLLVVAWSNDVPRARWWAIAPLALVAFASGPTLKYLEQTNALVALGSLVLAFGALEAFRRTGALWACLVAGLALAYTAESWFYAAIFAPLPFAAYAIANAKALFGDRRRCIYVICGIAVALLVALPSLLLDVKVDRTVEVARNMQQIGELTTADLARVLGAPGVVLPLVAVPAALFALVLVALRRANALERWVYGITIVALVLYSLSDQTPFAALVRHVYPPAGFIRRAYAAWYVLMPLIFFMSVRALRDWSPTTIRAGTVVSAAALAVACVQGTNVFAAVVVGVTLAVTLWRPGLLLVVAAMVTQWAVIDWLPFEQSAWRPQPIEARLAYFTPYTTLRPILPFEASSSTTAYRVANVGLPAEFGPFAGAFAVYNVAADYNTLIPHELVRELGTDQLHATVLPSYFQANPDALGGAPWERLAVRYYLFSPEAFAALQPAIAKRRLKVVIMPSYWRIVEDTHAAPFVASLMDDGRTEPVDAAMVRDAFQLVVPARATRIRFALNYDPWWHAYGANGADLSAAVQDDGGQLSLDARAIRGQSVRLRFTDRTVTIALAASLAVQGGIMLMFAVVLVRAGALRRRARGPVP